MFKKIKQLFEDQKENKEKTEQEKIISEKINPIIIPDFIRSIEITTPEIGMKKLNEYTRFMNKAIEYNQFNNALIICSEIDGIYEKIIEAFQKIGMESLIPSIKSQKERNHLKKYEIKYRIYSEEYNRLVQNIKIIQKKIVASEAQSTNKIDEKDITVAIKSIYELFDTWIQSAKEIEDTSQISKLNELKKEFEIIEMENELTIYIKTVRNKKAQIEKFIEDKDLLFDSEAEQQAIVAIRKFLSEVESFKDSELLKQAQSKIIDKEKLNRSIEIVNTLVNEIKLLPEKRIEKDLQSTITALTGDFNAILNQIRFLNTDNAKLIQGMLLNKIKGIKIAMDKMKSEFSIINNYFLFIENLLQKVIEIETTIASVELLKIYKMHESEFKSLTQSFESMNISITLQKNRKLREKILETKQSLLHKPQKSDFDSRVIILLDELEAQSKQFDKYIENVYKQMVENVGVIEPSLKPFNATQAQIELPKISPSTVNFNKASTFLQTTPNTAPKQQSFLVSNFQIPEIPVLTIKTPLYAKIIMIGDSSVGKTHLVLSITGAEYSQTQGSTIGIDKFYKPVKVPITNFDTQLCFWDLGGQYNYRTINELFINDASVIVVVFDVTRNETFQSLDYWLEMVKKLRGSNFNNILVVGNKLDVGGNIIPKIKLDSFLATYGLQNQYIETSAKAMVNIKELAEKIVGLINWTDLIKDIDERILEKGYFALKVLKKQKGVIPYSELVEYLRNSLQSDILIVKAMIKYYATQDFIILSSAERFVILEPDRVGKYIASLIEVANRKNGVIKRSDITNWPYSKSELESLLEYLEEENICYHYDNDYYFPSTIHEQQCIADEYTKQILDSDPLVSKITLSGKRYDVILKIIIILSKTWNRPISICEYGALWVIGKGLDKTAIQLTTLSGENSLSLKIQVGGGKNQEEFKRFMEIIKEMLENYGINYKM